MHTSLLRVRLKVGDKEKLFFGMILLSFRLNIPASISKYVVKVQRENVIFVGRIAEITVSRLITGWRKN